MDLLPWLIPELKGIQLATALMRIKRYNGEVEALVDMAELDQRLGITADDMQAYHDLNSQIQGGVPSGSVYGPEEHDYGGPHSRAPHGHVGPVDHIPIRPRRR